MAQEEILHFKVEYVVLQDRTLISFSVGIAFFWGGSFVCLFKKTVCWLVFAVGKEEAFIILGRLSAQVKSIVSTTKLRKKLWRTRRLCNSQNRTWEWRSPESCYEVKNQQVTWPINKRSLWVVFIRLRDCILIHIFFIFYSVQLVYM